MIVGKLCRESPGKRWIIQCENDLTVTLTCGDVIEVQIGGHWIATRIEYGDRDYYPMLRGIRFYDGMPARVPSSP